jgi:hypothetical protein
MPTIKISLESVGRFDVTPMKDGDLLLAFPIEEGEHVQVSLNAFEAAQLGVLVAEYTSNTVMDMIRREVYAQE